MCKVRPADLIGCLAGLAGLTSMLGKVSHSGDVRPSIQVTLQRKKKRRRRNAMQWRDRVVATRTQCPHLQLIDC